jgi:hypothetical protein
MQHIHSYFNANTAMCGVAIQTGSGHHPQTSLLSDVQYCPECVAARDQYRYRCERGAIRAGVKMENIAALGGYTPEELQQAKERWNTQ